MKKGKKILYITRYSLDQNFNLKKKFDGQVSAFRNLGFDVYFLGFDRAHLYLIHDNKKIVYGNTHFKIPLYLHTQFYNDLHKAAIKVIKENRIDIVYWRSAPIFGSSYRLAKTISENNEKLIIEIPTFPASQENNFTGIRKVFSFYSNHYVSKFQDFVDYYAVIGEDAGGEYKGKPAINIENGIDINSIHRRNPQIHDNEINILAVSAMRYWHGYDRLINSIADYHGKYRVVLHLVGGLDGECTQQWKQLAEQRGVTANIVFHGYLYGSDLDELADLCDLGCASLRRNDYAHVSELKTREYTARGLPFILALEDKSFVTADKQFWYLVPNDDSIPDMNGIIDFALKMREDKEMIPYMRQFAEENLTWEIQYKKLFDAIEQ